MNKMMVQKSTLLVVLLVAALQLPAFGQLKEPAVREADNPRTPVEEGYKSRIGGSFFLNNFGFGINGVYARALDRFTELTISIGASGIRDVSEQSFQNFFSGRRVIPDKYNRALGFPLMIGVKRRVFPRQIADNFRFYVDASGGPAVAFVYPYIDDEDGNGYRSTEIVEDVFGRLIRVYTEEKNSFFGGWGDGYLRWGAAGKLAVGVDLGRNFKRQTSLEIGFFFYYFNEGIQIMNPQRPVYDNQGQWVEDLPAYDKQSFFATPQLKFTYSGWW